MQRLINVYCIAITIVAGFALCQGAQANLPQGYQVGRYAIITRGGADSSPIVFLLDTATGATWRSIIFTDLKEYAWTPMRKDSEVLKGR